MGTRRGGECSVCDEMYGNGTSTDEQVKNLAVRYGYSSGCSNKPCDVCDAAMKQARGELGVEEEKAEEVTETRKLIYSISEEELTNTETDDIVDGEVEIPDYYDQCAECGGYYGDHFISNDGYSFGCVDRECEEGFVLERTRQVTVKDRILFQK